MVRLLALYSTDDGSHKGFFLNVGGIKIKIRIVSQLMSQERKIKKEKLPDFL